MAIASTWIDGPRTRSGRRTGNGSRWVLTLTLCVITLSWKKSADRVSHVTACVSIDDAQTRRLRLWGRIEIPEIRVTHPPCSYVMHWGQPVGEGALVTENGDRYEEQRVWHNCGDLSKITHWVEPHSSGTRYSMVAFFGPPPRVKRRSSTAPETCAGTPRGRT